MKEYIIKFKNSIKYAVSVIASREFAFIYCTIGTIAQISHTYFLINNISSLDGGFRMLQALMLSVFISSSLLYFTAISDNENTKESRKIHMAVTLFTVIEILINIYYYSRHLLIDNLENITINHTFDFVFAVIVSCLIPITIKLYSSHIRAKEWLDELFSVDKSDQLNGEFTSNIDPEIISELTNSMTDKLNALNDRIKELEATNDLDTDGQIDNYKQTLINEMRIEADNLQTQITNGFDKESKLFFNQFENKVKALMNKSTQQ